MRLSACLSKTYPDLEERAAIVRFAEVVGVTVVCADRYVRGQRIPRPAEMAKIREWSGGRVTADDFYRAYKRPAPAKRVTRQQG